MTVPTVGLLTRTLSDSPVVKFVLSLSQDKGFLFVGEDYVHRYTCNPEDGSITHQDSLPRLEHRIITAAVLQDVSHRQPGDPGVPRCPHSDILLLMLDNGSLEMITFATLDGSNGRVAAVHTGTIPLPRSICPLQALGPHMTLDSRRAFFAIAAPENCLLLYRIGEEIECCTDLSDHGYILHMDFLSEIEPMADACNILLVKVVGRKLVIQRLEWTFRAGQSHVKPFLHQRIDLGQDCNTSGYILPDLLIPLPSAGAFVLAASTELWLFTDIFTGHARQQLIKLPESDSPSPNTASPIWVSWHLCPQSLEILIFRDDGLMVRLADPTKSGDVDQILQSAQSGFPLVPMLSGVHSAFSSLEKEVLVVKDITGQGGVFVLWPNSDHVKADPHLNAQQLAAFPSWATGLDLVCSSLPRSSERRRFDADWIFMTSGTGDSGQIHELRPGLEASVFMAFDLEDGQPPVTIYTGPNFGLSPRHAEVDSDSDAGTHPQDLMMVFTPKHGRESRTQAVLFMDDGPWLMNEASIEADEPMLHGLDLRNHTTALARIRETNQMIQITDTTFNLVESLQQNARVLLDVHGAVEGTRISLANISVAKSGDRLITALYKLSAPETSFELALHRLSDGVLSHIGTTSWSSTVTVMRAFQWRHCFCCLLAGSDGSLQLCAFDSTSTTADTVRHYKMLEAAEESAAIEAVEVVGNVSEKSDPRVLCAFRNGTVELFSLGWNDNGEPGLKRLERHTLGTTTVMLSPLMPSNEQEAIFVAACDAKLFQITIPGVGDPAVVEHIWLTDRDDQSLSHENISGVTQVQEHLQYDGFDTFGSLVVVMGSRVMLASLQNAVRTAIPRAIVPTHAPPLATPVRMLYSDSLAHFVVAVIERRRDRVSSGGTKQCFRSIIEYRPVTGHKILGDEYQPVQALLQAGERVSALDEWKYTGGGDKKHVFTLVGTGLNTAGTTCGRIHILRPTLKRRQIDKVEFIHSIKLDDPVYCLAVLSETRFICGHGPFMSLYAYTSTFKKWKIIATYRLTSPAICVTYESSLIHVTTIRDSLMVFKLGESHESPEFHCIYTDSKAAAGFHHLTFPTTTPGFTPSLDEANTPASSCIDILSTKTAQLRGLSITTHSAHDTAHHSKAPCVFTAELTRSITRLRLADFSPDPTQPNRQAIGLATDGTLYGLSLLTPHDYCRLKALELLIRRSTLSDRCAPPAPLGNQPIGLAGLSRYADEGDAAFEARTGFAPETVDLGVPEAGAGEDGFVLPFVPRPRTLKEGDMHINGDVLARLVLARERTTNDPPVVAVEKMLWRETEREPHDRITALCKGRMEEELRLVPGVVELARAAVKRWGFW